MADIADRAQDEMEKLDELRGPRPEYDIPPGVEGDCDFCGEWSGRLVGGMCAPCRDRLARLAGGIK